MKDIFKKHKVDYSTAEWPKTQGKKGRGVISLPGKNLKPQTKSVNQSKNFCVQEALLRQFLHEDNNGTCAQSEEIGVQIDAG